MLFRRRCAALFAEKVHDLPCLITIDPILDAAFELPMLRNGYVTFGVFNCISKISDEAIRVWSKVMREVTGSKIIIEGTPCSTIRCCATA